MANDNLTTARDAILDRLTKIAENENDTLRAARATRELAEAWAWLTSPNCSHGGAS